MSNLLKQYLLLIFACFYLVSFAYEHDSRETYKSVDSFNSHTKWTLWVVYFASMSLGIMIILLFTQNKQVSLCEVANNVKQFNIFALGCFLYEMFCGMLILCHAKNVLNVFWGFNWIVQGCADVVPGLYFHHRKFTQFERKKSLMSYVLFIIYFGKLIDYLLNPGLFRHAFLNRIGFMYDCLSDDIS